MTADVNIQSLPEIVPVFPLTGVLLLPGTVLPLHIFEQRYRNMVGDALNANGIFGMIQPFVPQQDNRPLPGAEHDKPELYKVGCAGRIESCEKTPDGRYMIQLRGVSRFRCAEELPLLRGYRRVKADYREFRDWMPESDWRCDREALKQALKAYGKAHGIELRMERASRLSDTELINLLGVSLPFHPAEKQALLEARSLKDRENVLIDLLRIAASPTNPGSDLPPRMVN